MERHRTKIKLRFASVGIVTHDLRRGRANDLTGCFRRPTLGGGTTAIWDQRRFHTCRDRAGVCWPKSHKEFLDPKLAQQTSHTAHRVDRSQQRIRISRYTASNHHRRCRAMPCDQYQTDKHATESPKGAAATLQCGITLMIGRAGKVCRAKHTERNQSVVRQENRSGV